MATPILTLDIDYIKQLRSLTMFFNIEINKYKLVKGKPVATYHAVNITMSYRYRLENFHDSIQNGLYVGF